MYEALNAVYVLTDLGCWGQTTEGRAVSTLVFLTGEVNKSQEVTILCPWMVIRIWTEMFSFKVLIATTHICMGVYVVCLCVHMCMCVHVEVRDWSLPVFPSCSPYFLRQSLSLSAGRINLGVPAGSWDQALPVSALPVFRSQTHASSLTPLCAVRLWIQFSGFPSERSTHWATPVPRVLTINTTELA